MHNRRNKGWTQDQTNICLFVCLFVSGFIDCQQANNLVFHSDQTNICLFVCTRVHRLPTGCQSCLSFSRTAHEDVPVSGQNFLQLFGNLALMLSVRDYKPQIAQQTNIHYELSTCPYRSGWVCFKII